MKLKSTLLLTVLAFLSLSVGATAPLAPTNLRCFDRENPTGTGNHPYFGWYVNDPDINEKQTAYQIIVSSTLQNLFNNIADGWNSLKVTSSGQNYIYAESSSIYPGKRYYWKVRTWDKNGNVSPYSKPAIFETGLFSNTDWAGAKWIKRNSKDADDYTYFRKKTWLPQKTIRRATAYIAACQSYELYVNGRFIGKGFDNQYPQYSYYHAWDILPALLKDTSNVFACLTHWYGGGQGRATGSRGLLMKAVIEFADSTSIVICTDGSWKQKQAEQWVTGQPQRNGEGIGRIEMFDARKILNHWNDLSFDDSGWAVATETGEHPIAPWTGTLRADLTRVTEEEIRPVSVTGAGSGKYIIDLGKIYPGSFRINFTGGNAGDTIKMYGGFVLNDDGTVSTRINQETNLNFYFIHNGGEAVFNPYVYLGLRYLQVNNSPNPLTTDNVRFICRHYELDPSRASFESSNPMLNKVWNLMTHSLINGAQEGFVDTPTREKGSFLCDGWSQAVPAMSVMGDRIMNARVLQEFLDSQDQYWPDGRLNAVYPNVDGARDIPDFTQSYLVWVWDYYMQTGNTRFLKTNYMRLKKIADYEYAYRNDTTGLIQKLKGGKGPYEYGIIDWPANMRHGYDMDASARTVINVYAYAGLDILSKIAGVLGNTADRDSYNEKAEGIKTAINSQLINAAGVYTDGFTPGKGQSTHVSQHANIYPLAMGIVPDKNIQPVAAEIKKQKMNVGMVGLRWLPEAVGSTGDGNHLLELYTNPQWDGWAKTVALGGTVTWESWDANEVNTSMSHPWGAVGLLGIQQYMLGVRPLTPQYGELQIKPLEFNDKLTHVRGICNTDRGNVQVEWLKSANSFTLTATLPVNTCAVVYIPRYNSKGTTVIVDGIAVQGTQEGKYLCLKNIGSGKHTFEKKLNTPVTTRKRR